MKKIKANKIALSAAGISIASVLAFSGLATPILNASALSEHNGKWYTDFNTIEEAHEYAAELNVELMNEGIVMMKNNNNVLPLKQGTTMSVLGARSYDVVAGGTGAGSGAGISVTLPDALRGAGFKLNRMVESLYSNLESTANISSGSYGGSSSRQTVQEDPATLANVESSFYLYDTIVWTISRIGGEGSDLSRGNLPNNEDPTKHYLEFSDNEIKMVKYLEQLKADGLISKVVLLLNVPNVVELGPAANSDAIDSILWIGQPGPNGLEGVGNVLNGSVTPSGRTNDIWNADHKKDPTWVNFGDNAQNTWNEETGAFDRNSPYYGNDIYATVTTADDPETPDVDESSSSLVAQGNSNTLEYEEGIYFGYKYYETADVEKPILWDYDGDGEKDPFDYSKEVVYPFGYGLSYTTFSQEIVTTDIAEQVNAATGLDDKISIDVEVTNTGDTYSGKEVVQIYVTAPYTDGGIEKAAVQLVGFAKTKTLLPGASQIVTVEVRLADIAAFDYDDANNNGYKGYEIEAGNYEFKAMMNSHEAYDAAPATLTAKTLDNDEDATNNTPFSNGDDFDTLLITKEADSKSEMKIMSRADMEATFPTASTQEERQYGVRVTALLERARFNAAGTSKTTENGQWLRYHDMYNSSDDLETDPWYKTNADIPENWTQAANTESRTDGLCAVLLKDMAGLDYWSDEIVPEGHVYAGMTEAEAWAEFVNQLTWSEMTTLLSRGQYRTNGLEAVQKDQASDQDGASRLTSAGATFCTAVVIASTWNVELAEMQGRAVGNDSLFTNTEGWYAPSMNTHRNPFCGRNFEYYSQDALHAGYIAAAVVRGYQSKGGYAYIKHYALNDQETDREGVATWASEQAMRENILKSFELAVKEGKAMAVMTCFNRIGGVHGAGNYHSITTVLRNEWGFKGQIVTDFYFQNMTRANIMQRAGGDIPLGSFSGQNVISGTWDPTLRGGLGGVRDGNADENGVVPESATQYVAIRECATRVLWVGANTNNNTNSLDRSALTYGDAEFVATVGSRVNFAMGINAEQLGTNDLTYSATGLPEGLTMNEGTGAVSGTPSEIGTFNVTVNITADKWINLSLRTSITINPNVTAVTGEAITLTPTVYNVGDSYGSGWQAGTVTASTIEVISEDGLTLVDGVIAGVFNKAGTYSVIVNNTITYSSRWGGSQTTTLTSAYVIVVTGEDIEAPVVPEATVIVSAELQEDGSILITFSDGTTTTITDGKDGAQGIQGEKGDKGDQGEQGIQGEKGDKGDQGEQGIQGEKGDKGDQGEQGIQGEKGDKGDQGEQGIQGEKGDKGDKGDTGAAGANGTNGKDADVDGIVEEVINQLEAEGSQDGLLSGLLSGCNGSVAGLASVVALLTIGGALAIRKKND